MQMKAKTASAREGFCKKTEQILVSKHNNGSANLSFLEGLAIYLAQGYLADRWTESVRYGYLAQRAT